MICHARLLKIDDVCLKRKSRNNILCPIIQCNTCEVEDAKQFIVCCPVFMIEQNGLVGEINVIPDGISFYLY